MDILNTIIALVFCLLAANVVSYYIPAIPDALIQIFFGIILAILFPNLSIEVEAKWFLTLFVAPLLYHDGKYFPREQLWKLRVPILSNAIILVILTTVIGGWFIHLLLPNVPLGVAFSLSAILSPTDPIAVNGIAKRLHMPSDVLTIVRGEALINDATGLIAFKYAVAAVVTGYFSLGTSLVDFTYVFFVGAISGFVLSLIATWIRFLLRKIGITESVFYSLWQIMIPFAVFIITEEVFNASGVIAVLVAGLTHASVKERTETIVAEETMLTENTMSVLVFTLNGFIFLLLGLQIPTSMKDTLADPNIGNGFLIWLVLIIGFVLLLIRFIWSLVYEGLKYMFKSDRSLPTIRSLIQISLSGSRGAMTMIGILTLPYFVMDGSPFPERSLVIFLAAGIILVTLLVATFILPLACHKKVDAATDDNAFSLFDAKERILGAVIKHLRKNMTEENEAAASSLVMEYKQIFQQRDIQIHTKKELQYLQVEVVEIKKMALKMEQKYTFDLMNSNVIDEELCEKAIKHILFQERALNSRTNVNFLDVFGYFSRQWKFYRHYFRMLKDKGGTSIRAIGDMQVNVAQKVIHELLELKNDDKSQDTAIKKVLSEYQMRIDRIRSRTFISDDFNIAEQKEELRILTLEVERREIQKMYEEGLIIREQVQELRRFVNYIENIVLFENSM